MGNSVGATPGKIKLIGIVRDKLGRIVVDESVFHDKELLEKIRQEVIQNGRNT
jgi:hypothetical protein